MKVKVIVTLKNGVLDPQGKAIQQTLNGMNFDKVSEVRQWIFFVIVVKENVDLTTLSESTVISDASLTESSEHRNL